MPDYFLMFMTIQNTRVYDQKTYQLSIHHQEKIGPKSVAGSQTHMRESVHMFQKLEQEGMTAWVLC